MRPSPKWSSPKNNKKNNGFGERDYYAAPSDPSNPENPIHPDETSVSVASPSGS
jgi:hypothetical protein